MEQWVDLGLYSAAETSWGAAFQSAMTKTIEAGGRVHFNLAGLDIGAAMAGDAGTWVGRYTAWEFQTIATTPAFREATTFYLDGIKYSWSEVATMFGL